MKTLALEFSSPQRSVAVSDLGAGARVVEAVETGGRETKAFGLIESVLRQAQLEREQIECLAVGLGPGSYNGIRAAIALAQGWQLARGTKLLGISSADCVAAEAQARGLNGLATVVIDAQRGEFYLADYELGPGECRVLKPLRLGGLADVQARQQDGSCLLGPEVDQWFQDGRVVLPGAAALARLAASRTNFASGDKLVPIYLRETQFVKAPPPRKVPL